MLSNPDPHTSHLLTPHDSQSDVLLGILKELSSGIKQEEEDDDDSSEASESSPSLSPPPMVGPTAAELDSLNELIRFDHIYVKSETTPTPPTSSSPPQPIIINKIESKPMVSVLRPIQPKRTTPTTAITSIIKTPAVVKVEAAPVVPPPASDAPLNLHLGDLDDLEALTDPVDVDVDFETMYKELVDMPDYSTVQQQSVRLNTDALESNPQTLNTTTTNNNNNKRKSTDIHDTFINKKVKQEDDDSGTLKLNLNIEGTYQPGLSTPDPTESLFDFDPEFLSTSVSHSSGYGSDEALSPQSDSSGQFDNALNWEEDSFVELFPSLV